MIKEDIEWFKLEVEPSLIDYEIIYKHFEEGDFGALNQVEFNSTKLGGNVDFWGLDWLGIFLWSYEEDRELINILLEPHEEANKQKALNDLLNFLKQ